jgi:hypothetical protein
LIRGLLEDISGHKGDAQEPGADDPSVVVRQLMSHWSGPAFTPVDLRQAASLVTTYAAFGDPEYLVLGNDVPKNLLTRAYNIEIQLGRTVGSGRQALMSALSATAFVLWVVTQGSGAGNVPSSVDPWGPWAHS